MIAKDLRRQHAESFGIMEARPGSIALEGVCEEVPGG
jgi:hypothetical protein